MRCYAETQISLVALAYCATRIVEAYEYPNHNLAGLHLNARMSTDELVNIYVVGVTPG